MFVARTAELEKLTEITDRQRSSFVALYGRRRIGKTVLVRQFVKQNRLNAFEFSGRYDQSKAQIIRSFVRSIKLLFKHNNNNPITDWNAAFGLLIDYLKSLDNQTKTVVFLDELPWIDTAKSGFLAELAEFWNNFCARKQNIILIVCGSAASYMLKKVIHNKGSLHGRLTDIIPLQQFDLNASKQLLSSQGCQYSDKTIVDTYMLLGGVAKYLESLNCQLTPAQSINNLCFKNDGLLKYEYQDLFLSLFNDSKVHYRIMDTLSTKWSGYTQKELASKVKVSAFYIKKPLEQLAASGFISATTKFNQLKRDVIYRATDCFSYFYHKWMKNNQAIDWQSTVNTQSYKSWSGFAFENICHMHSTQIKKVLGISGVPTKSHYWNYTAKDSSEQGAAIDLLLEHVNGSNNIDIIECKYYADIYTLSKNYKNELQRKINVFNKRTKYKYNIRLIFITVHGMVKNAHYNELVSKDIRIAEIIQVV